MALPSCICVAGRPPFERLGDIFCALSQIDLGCVIPVVLSASIDGNIITIVFSEEVTGQDGFNGTVAGVPAAFTYASGEGTSTYTFESDTPAAPGDEVLLSYDIGGNIANEECLLAPFADLPVTNNTGLATQRVTSDGDLRITSAGDIRIIT